MTQVMTARLSQPGIAGLLPAPSPGNRVTAIGGRSVGSLAWYHCAVLAWRPACRPASLKRMIYFIYA